MTFRNQMLFPLSSLFMFLKHEVMCCLPLAVSTTELRPRTKQVKPQRCVSTHPRSRARSERGGLLLCTEQPDGGDLPPVATRSPWAFLASVHSLFSRFRWVNARRQKKETNLTVSGTFLISSAQPHFYVEIIPIRTALFQTLDRGEAMREAPLVLTAELGQEGGRKKTKKERKVEGWGWDRKRVRDRGDLAIGKVWVT